MATASEKRAQVIAKYKSILGRNRYSQAKRAYAFKKYSDGKYYSDCSSSIALSYKEAGYPLRDNGGNTCPNTVGMYQSTELVDVSVTIKNGVIQNPEALRIGDILLFAGSDNSRRYADCVGHVEMVAAISSSKVTLYGHGSGTPRATEMVAYCKSRYASKTTTVIGNKGLLKVRRRIADDAADPDTPGDSGESVTIAPGSWNVRSGPGTAYPAVGVVQGGEVLKKADTGGWVPLIYKGEVRWIGPSTAVQKELAVDSVVIAPGSWNVRTGPGTACASVAVVKGGNVFKRADADGWVPVIYNGEVRWIGPSAVK